ncbi:MAG: stage 0 sporulation family protein [Clostridiales bacterium]|nr:stage 0 sporulation family protein [Clostridiales bacterium]
MHLVVGVRFRNAGKIYYFSPGDIQLDEGDSVIVETARGVEFGDIALGPRRVPEKEVVLPLKHVMRKASTGDLLILEDNQKKESDAFDICLEKIAKHSLPMKLIDVEYTFDGNKIIFYFTADGRVDFRELVKDLAAIFRTRIELRQIGVRDEAKMIGGLGPCGCTLCCTSFLEDFEPVSIKMAKEQNLSLNPSKISGMCGRLMCCLRFEQEFYETMQGHMPDIGEMIITPKGEGSVIDVNMLKETVRAKVLLEDETYEVMEFGLGQIQRAAKCKNKGGCCRK